MSDLDTAIKLRNHLVCNYTDQGARDALHDLCLELGKDDWAKKTYHELYGYHHLHCEIAVVGNICDEIFVFPIWIILVEQINNSNYPLWLSEYRDPMTDKLVSESQYTPETWGIDSVHLDLEKLK